MNSQLFSQSLCIIARKFHAAAALTSRPSALVDSIIRVDHAGELGADRIYAGQMAILKNTKMAPVIQQMWDQEKEHKAAFENLIVKNRVRPTLFVPVWNVAGFLLGAGTALMGEKAAMACTVAVEAVIIEHYNDQLRELMQDPVKNKELMQTIQKFRDDEQEHHDHGLYHGAEQAPFYSALTEVIKFGCKTAIAISKGLFSSRNQLNFNVCRMYATSTAVNLKKNWDLYSAVCLQRKPVLLKPFTEVEQKVAKVFFELENERSHKSDHEVQGEEVLARANSVTELVNMEAALKQTAHEFEEKALEELQKFNQSFSITATEDNNVKSLNRHLSSHLLFLINEKIGLKNYWMFPQGMRKTSETLRQTAERVLREKCGENLNVLFLGNAPCGFYKYIYPKKLNSQTLGAKVFFFKAIYVSGQVQLVKNSECDYQWATQRDLCSFLNKDYLKKVSLFLIEDD